MKNAEKVRTILNLEIYELLKRDLGRVHDERSPLGEYVQTILKRQHEMLDKN